MKPRMTWKIRAVGSVELTRRLTVPGAAYQGSEGDRREDCGLWGLKSELLLGCVTLESVFPSLGLHLLMGVMTPLCQAIGRIGTNTHEGLGLEIGTQ